jgi:hypothetical protein
MKSAKLHLVNPSETASLERAQAIDRLGTLHSILADYAVQIAPFEAEADELEAKLLALYEGKDAAQVFTDEGSSYRLRVGACAETQQLDVAARAKVLKEIGKEAYLALCKPTFEALKSALTPAKYEQLIRKERVGKRSIKTVVKAAPEPVKAAA